MNMNSDGTPRSQGFQIDAKRLVCGVLWASSVLYIVFTKSFCFCNCPEPSSNITDSFFKDPSTNCTYRTHMTVVTPRGPVSMNGIFATNCPEAYCFKSGLEFYSIFLSCSILFGVTSIIITAFFGGLISQLRTHEIPKKIMAVIDAGSASKIIKSELTDLALIVSSFMSAFLGKLISANDSCRSIANELWWVGTFLQWMVTALRARASFNEMHTLQVNDLIAPADRTALQKLHTYYGIAQIMFFLLLPASIASVSADPNKKVCLSGNLEMIIVANLFNAMSGLGRRYLLRKELAAYKSALRLSHHVSVGVASGEEEDEEEASHESRSLSAAITVS
ncbi:MAG: hypothetical protein A3E84_00045 [Gammaproteobacteria bacterium RIFCSPHIGHO2_12_FULL_42_13]|nr:MAG: hypothetical protein A3E84_00045 [Gammaproteobacteria bacterium RIFCSPHIGHO2_12_FULL_42_13]